MRQLWTDDDLDQALAELHADVRPNPNGLAAARERVLAGAPARSRFRRPWLPIAAAAAAAGLVSGVLVLLPHTAQPAAPPSNGPTPIALSDLLARIHYSDPTVAPGQYHYTDLHELAGSSSANRLVAKSTSVWRPYQWTDGWERSRSTDGTFKVTYANGAITVAEPEDTFSRPLDIDRAGCGNLDAAAGAPVPCIVQAGSWTNPTPEWLASLPTDPEQLVEKLMAATQPSQSVLYLAIRTLASGTVPANIRAALYRALTLMPGGYGLENVPNLDHRRGLAIGVEDNGIHDEIVINPADGTFLGERQYDPGTGTVIVYSAMDYGIAGSLGIAPR